MRFNLGPMTNQLTAIGNSMQSSVALDSQGVEAATAASTRAGHKEAEEERLRNHRSPSHRRNWSKVSILVADLVELNFEFGRNKNSMGVFTIRLRRVYQD